MGQHRVQRALLQSFGFPGSQPNSTEVWHLARDSYEPRRRSVRRTGLFEIPCAPSVDKIITEMENDLKDVLKVNDEAELHRLDDPLLHRSLLDFAALHYVRGESFLKSLYKILVEYNLWDADPFYRKYARREDPRLFLSGVKAVGDSLTFDRLDPAKSKGQFITSDHIVVSLNPPVNRGETGLWTLFPISKNLMLRFISDSRSALAGLWARNPATNELEIASAGQSPLLTRNPDAAELTARQVVEFNCLMAQGSNNLYAPTRESIDACLSRLGNDSQYRYKP